MDVFTIKLLDIQPSQLYISADKLTEVEQMLDCQNVNSFEPLPIKKIGQKIFFTDGHTRAYVLYKLGVEEITVYWEPDELDWTVYLINLNWCDEEGIRTIADLGTRIICHDEYETLWLKRCKAMHEKLQHDPFHDLRIAEVSDPEEKSEICGTILRQLPNWFGIEESIVQFCKDVQEQNLYAAYIGHLPIGLIAILDHYPFSSEISVMGILQEFHKRGIGRKLLTAAEIELVQKKKKFLVVKTLSDSHPDPDYGRTREFYYGVGFCALEEMKHYWNEENPCLYMVKPLS